MEKKRNSSLELLRIICMLLIIFHHYAIHGGFDFKSTEILSGNELFINTIVLFGKLACNIFILITGYFMINSKFNIKKVINIIIKMFIYNFLVVIFIYATGFDIDISIKQIIKYCFPIFFGNWFVVNYILLCCIAPFLNLGLTKIEKEQYSMLVFVLIILWSLMPTFSNNIWGFSNIDGFIVMYIIGGYIKRFSAENTVKNKSNLIISIVFIVLIMFSSIFLTFAGHILKIDVLIDKSGYFSKIFSIFVVIASIYIFKYFKNIEFYNKFINYIAASMLGVYLIHDNGLIRIIVWEKIVPNINYQNSNYLVLHAVCKCFIIFIICVIIDKIVSKILKTTINKTINNKVNEEKAFLRFKLIKNKFNKILE